MAQYELMHQDVLCGIVTIDVDSGILESYTNRNDQASPFLGRADTRLMRRWWEARAIPASRIAESYAQKLALLQEFQAGKTISLYRETH